VATVRSLSRIPVPAPDTVQPLLIVVIKSSPTAALAGHVCRLRVCYQPSMASMHFAALHNF
jgi:hypothetical protein